MSLVEDGMTLLDSVPLVCRRWRRLSREPAAWADVDIHVGLIHPPDDAARLLLHAPTLRQLHMEVVITYRRTCANKSKKNYAHKLSRH
ncbi:hypothetical protein ONE63_007285 [Megalurothrips usitatus]|uniref:F-box domain-containing protein n=1 Tax=Megalurothrips usitatus TaxID=439358 RepID=A0AAV7XRJ7_9NEOP|nr:hypothetical protein ONE63_007285 [Megalurothrips usitatus]